MMKKTIIFVLLLLVIHIASVAQSDSNVQSQKSDGYDRVLPRQKEPLRVKIPEKTLDVLVHDSLPMVFFLIDESNAWTGSKVRIKSYSLETGKPLWATPTFRYLINDHITRTPMGLLVDGLDITLFDYNTGEKIFTKPGHVAALAKNDSMVVAYQGDNNDKLVGIDLTDGKELWKTKVLKNYGEPWIPLKQMDDSTQLYMGDHLWLLNVYTGQRKEHKLHRRIFNKKRNAASLALGVMGMAVGGMASYSPSYVEDLNSHLLDLDSLLFIADRDAIVCLDRKLDEVWRTDLPEGDVGRSDIAISGDTLKLLNTGLGKDIDSFRVVGKPFYATYNIYDGTQLTFMSFPDKFDKTVFGDMLYFMPTGFYIYTSLTGDYKKFEIGRDRFALLGAEDIVLIVDGNLNIVQTIPLSQIFLLVGANGENIVLQSLDDSQRNTMIEVGPDGKIVDIIFSNETPKYAGNNGKVFVVDGDSLVESPDAGILN